ncbi:MAG: hypothetical protein ACRCSF_03185, partial [Mycobacteriaceae bacterium]
MFSITRLASVFSVVLVTTSLLFFPEVAQANPSIPGSSSGPNGLIWLPNYGQNSVMAFDPVTLENVATIKDIGDHPLVIKSSLDHSKLFVGNFGPIVPGYSWNVSVIDVASRTLIKRIPTLGAAYAVSVLSHDGKFLWVPTSLSVMQVIDTTTLEVVKTLPIAFPPGPAHLELSPDDSIVYVFSATGHVTKYDANTGLPLALPLFVAGLFPGWGTTSVDGGTMYAISYFSGIATIDTRKWEVTRILQMPLNAGPISATLTPDGTKLWMCNYNDKEILIFDTATGNQVRRVKTDLAPVYVGFSGDGKQAYITFVDSNSGLPESLYFPYIPTGDQNT